MKFMKEIMFAEFWKHPSLKVLTAMLAAYVACWLIIDFNIDTQIQFVFSYFYPVFVVFFLYIFDRLQFFSESNRIAYIIDVVVLFFSILRMVYKVPYISGHALFLSFALFTMSSHSTRVMVFIVWMQVLLLKLFLWHDVTFYGGLVAGGIAAVLWVLLNRLPLKQKAAPVE